MRLSNLSTVEFFQWLNCVAPSDTSIKRLIVVASGYERRSSYWSQKVLGILKPSPTNQWCVLGFTDHKDDLCRIANDSFYRAEQLNIDEFPSDDDARVVAYVRDAVTRLTEQYPNSEIEIHIDYSSIPRTWYCAIFSEIERSLDESGRLYFWYSAGIYDGIEYPTAGVSDVELFSGQPSLRCRDRTHIFGLGFDRIRSSAIFRVLDPQSLVCFYADPGIRPDYVKRVIDDNRDIIAAGRLVFSVPIHDFALAFGRIAGVAREFAALGDVILVPDGPKPLVLASSLVPGFLGKSGVVSLHVRHRKIAEAAKVGVQAAGEIYGFSVRGTVDDLKSTSNGSKIRND
jgi:hypothetical protein